MSTIKFKIAAKTDVGRVRNNNEDNLQAADDLTTAPMKWVNNQVCDLGNKGALLVVADGMGGMNAGEVASEIAINTIKEFFSPEKITKSVLESRVSIETFMKKSIVEADKRIKADAKLNSEHKDMGTTIVIAWLIEEKLYVAWCGDSRAYIYNKINGIRQISKDHSYVQTLVDQRKISPEDAFDYPDSNIITRCLSDSEQKARPDTLPSPIDVHNGDIILLCTDGLNGMIRDHEIELVLMENESDLSLCADKLIEAACEAAGHDNVTVAMCQIISGATEAQKIVRKNKLSNTIGFSRKTSILPSISLVKKISSILVTAIIVFGGGFIFGKYYKNETSATISDQDSTKIIVDIVEFESMKNQIKDLDSTKYHLENILNDTISHLKDSVNKYKKLYKIASYTSSLNNKEKNNPNDSIKTNNKTKK